VVTGFVHGDAAVRQSKLAAAALFGGGALDAESLEALRGIVPESEITTDLLAGDEPVVEVLVASGVASSRGDARRTLQQGGIRINGEKVEAADATVSPVDGRYVLLQKGKKQRHLVVISA